MFDERVKRLESCHLGKGYDYSQTVFVNEKTKICVICATHGEFWQLPSNHRRGNGCPKCAKEARWSDTFKQKCKKLGVDYWRALKRREAGMSDDKILSPESVRSLKETASAVTVGEVFYPNIMAACIALDPPASVTTIERWIAKGMNPDEAFERVPNPGYRNGIIYCVTHLESGKKYIGLTVQSIERRWTYHLEQAAAGHIKSEQSLHAAIRMFGATAFRIEKIDEGTTKVDLERKERHWIEIAGTLAPNGFNLDKGGVSGGSNSRPVEVDGIKFPSVHAATSYIADVKGISFDAAGKRLLVGRVHVRKPAKPGESLVKSKAYKAWSQIVHTVTNPKSKGYKQGIEMHAPWRSFDVFLADAGQPVSADYCFARKDKNIGFTPDNCAWMTKSDASKINAAHMKSEGRLTGRLRDNRVDF